MAGKFAPAINLGGIDKTPSVANVLGEFEQLKN
jgi:hypothetical protein